MGRAVSELTCEIGAPARSASKCSTRPRLLNLGCGARAHAAWTNVDLNPAHALVRAHNVREGLPFAGGAFDAVYHAHLLEHLPIRAAPGFLSECYRVLRHGGVLRVVVPDLEQIARLYLEVVPAAWRQDPEAEERHGWLLMELYDQTTRECPGGEMLRALAHIEPGSFAWQRIGADGAPIRTHLQSQQAAPAPRWRQRLRGWLFGSWRERLLRRLLGAEYELLQLGRFRRAGEVHQWMYDRVTLRTLLNAAGFDDFRCVSADESDIADWQRYGLDVLPDGRAAKPDSIYVEARKP